MSKPASNELAADLQEATFRLQMRRRDGVVEALPEIVLRVAPSSQPVAAVIWRGNHELLEPQQVLSDGGSASCKTYQLSVVAGSKASP